MTGDQRSRQVERRRRWRLALGGDEASTDLSERDGRVDRALNALYAAPGAAGSGTSRRGGLGGSAPRVARWLGDIREFFPAPVVQVIQKDAFTRLGLKQMLLQPEFMSALEADVHLVADLISLRAAMPAKAIETARIVVRKVVDELLARLDSRTRAAIHGARDRSRRTRRPRPTDIDWARTIHANLRHWQPEHRTIVPQILIGSARKQRRSDLDEVMLCVDQSGSMGPSVVYGSIFSAVMASIPAITTKLVLFDTAVVDMTDQLSDPVEALFGIQLGGGTDIGQALLYCEQKIEVPSRTHLVLITDLFEGGDVEQMLLRVQDLVARGVNLIVLLALNDEGRPSFDSSNAGAIARMGVPVFACTPDLFPDLMATALRRGDMAMWAAQNDIALFRGA